MHTFQDLLEHAEEKNAHGTPLVPNWPQMRGYLYLLRHVCGDLTLPLTDFDARFPEDWNQVAHADRAKFPGAGPRVYHAMRRELSHLLSNVGHIHDPWDALVAAARMHARKKYNAIVDLRRHARNGGIALTEVTDQWARTAHAALPNTEQRRFRAALSALNTLHDVPQIARLGLLPDPVIVPKSKTAQQKTEDLAFLPSFLLCEPNPGALSQTWGRLRAAGVLSADHTTWSAEQLMDTELWTDIDATPTPTGVTRSSWEQYLNRLRRSIRRHTTPQ